MAKIAVNVQGTSYPCRATMGAARRFKKETGREVSELTEGDISDFAVYLWCCVSSSCSADGIPFCMELEDFADRIDMEDLMAWAELTVKAANGPKGKKAKASL